MDYSHQERLCDLTVIEGKARRRHIVERRERRDEANTATSPAAKDSSDNDGRERERRLDDTVSRLEKRDERGYATRTAKRPAYDATSSTRIACVVKKTRFTL